jgi:hypothetical protein
MRTEVDGIVKALEVLGVSSIEIGRRVEFRIKQIDAELAKVPKDADEALASQAAVNFSKQLQPIREAIEKLKIMNEVAKTLQEA